MDAFYTDQFVLPLPFGHRFPMQKYRLLRDKIAAGYPLVHLQEPYAARRSELLLAHAEAYVDQVFQGNLSPAQQKEIGFPWSPAMVQRSVRSVGATVDALRSVMGHGTLGAPQNWAAVNLAGGTHHAKPDAGSGFCVFNDTVVAARVLQAMCPGARVLVIDLDVHQGDGTALCTQGDESIFTLSLHGEKNYPFQKQISDLDIALPDGCQDDAYLLHLEWALAQVEQVFEPDFVFYLAGLDVHENDRLGRLSLTDSGIESRDSVIFSWLAKNKVPVVMSMAGGYFQDLHHLTELQAGTVGRLLKFAQTQGQKSSKMD